MFCDEMRKLTLSCSFFARAGKNEEARASNLGRGEMRITTSVIMTICLALSGTVCSAADASGNGELPAMGQQVQGGSKGQQVVDESRVRRNQKLRAWVNSIRPAAGNVAPHSGAEESSVHPGNEYWRQSVRRENRGSMRE